MLRSPQTSLLLGRSSSNREADFLDKPFKLINATQTQASDFRDNQELDDVFTTLWKRVQYQIDRRLTTFTPMDSASTFTTTPTVAKAAPINVELPKFDGDPLQCRKFHTMFTAAITTRAVGFSELDKKYLLSNSILPQDGKDIVDNAPEKEDLSQLLERLKRRYGRPQVVVPLLIKKIDQPQSFSFDYEGVHHTQIFQGYDALEPYMENSLSSYLLYRTTMSLTPAAKKIWDNAVTKREVKPTSATSGPTWRIVLISWPRLISRIRTHRLPLPHSPPVLPQPRTRSNPTPNV